MTLTRLLEIERKLLGPEDDLGLSFAELLWNEAGCPAEGDALCRALENILCACQREGVRYPPILLRRKKELQRGVWKPRSAPAAPQAHAAPGASAARPAGRPEEGSVCKLCGGAGVITNPGGHSATLCECYLRRLQRPQANSRVEPAPGIVSKPDDPGARLANS